MGISNSEIAEIFAQGNQKRTGSNIFIEGRTIYSYGYHFPISFKLGLTFNPDCNKIALFNNRDYSMTTSRHKSEVRSALRSKGYTLIEAELNSDSDLSDDRIKEVLNKQFHDNEKEVNKLISELPRKRTERTKEVLKDRISELTEQNKLIVDLTIIDRLDVINPLAEVV